MVRVLVVEDLETYRTQLCEKLRAMGYEVEEATGPEAALEQFRRFRPDVAIIDYRCLNSLPDDRSGILVAMRSDPLVPKIMISAVAEREEVMQAVHTSGAGFPLAVRFLAKSEFATDPSSLVEAITVAMQIRRVWLRQARENVGPELHLHYRAAWWLAIAHSIVLIVVGLAFAGLGMYLIVGAHANFIEGLTALICAVVGEWLILLLMRRGEPLFEIARRHHAELAERAGFEQLLEACEHLESATERDAERRAVIARASERWLADGRHRQGGKSHG